MLNGSLIERAPFEGVMGAAVQHFPKAKPASWRDFAFTAAELDKEVIPPLQFIIPGTLPEGLTLLAGAPKFGKSYLALDWALAIASGGTASGAVTVEQGDVLYIALEDGKRRLQSRMRKFMPGRPKPNRLDYAINWKNFDEGGVEMIVDWLDDHPEAKLVILDTWVNIKPKSRGKANQYDEDAQAIKPLRDIARDRPGVAFIVIHHVRKMTADSIYDTISGTNGLVGIPDTLMVLAPFGEGAKLCAKGRDVEGYEKALNRDANTGGWIIAGDAAGIAKTTERQDILDALAEAEGEPMTLAAIATVTGKRKSNLAHLLKKMAADGLVKKAGYGRYQSVHHSNHSNYSNLDGEPQETDDFYDDDHSNFHSNYSNLDDEAEDDDKSLNGLNASLNDPSPDKPRKSAVSDASLNSLNSLNGIPSIQDDGGDDE